MSKGSRRRLSNISNIEYGRNYDRIFKGVEPEVPSATQVECAAIVKRSDVWPMKLGDVDLTKMNHPTACKYLVKGMKVKLIRGANNDEKNWNNSWVDKMNRHIGTTYTIEKIESDKGVSFVEIGCRFPAFCLQIIE